MLSISSITPGLATTDSRANPAPTRSPLASADPAEQQRLRELQETDRKVRAHEAAHLAAAGGLAVSGASFTLTRGSDGRYYATGGEVSISTSEGRNPQDSLARAQQIRAAALAPADPSAQDYRVAAQAARMEASARQALAAQQSEAVTGGTAGTDDTAGDAMSASQGVPRAPDLTAAYGNPGAAGRLLDLFA